MDNRKVYLNASEHFFNLGLSETLMLRNYARINKFKFCSMIGGPESIRDLYEARNLDSDSFQFLLVESTFSIKKIFSAIEKVFLDRLEIFNKSMIFIDICSIDGMNMILDLDDVLLPNFIEKSNIVFNFDRRSITKTYQNISNSDFEYSEFEEQTSPLIYERLNFLNNLGYLTSLSGGIDSNSLSKIFKRELLPDFIRTGLFTLPIASSTINDFSNYIRKYQVIEAKILNLMKDSLYDRYEYINKRQIHLVNYLVDSLI